ncbi:MAG: protein-L-isoaspartate(D-aspartate) O-methyltransferase [Anaerolineales bacterium]|nr:protein-L-isoaspartate(D-aspartate) O-methyltransferase [Anaerolineales bacterium]MDW8161473.1 protein-L-isoaspartate(D-aspartate) O-methyltransferase [Anaerolineales bacterium]
MNQQDEEAFFERERKRMVDEQLRRRGIHEPRLLKAMLKVPRHRFVPLEHRHLAYVDGPLPIGAGQTISQPYIVALMTQLLLLEGDEKVLEVGTGSGYQAAILGELARVVHTIELHAELAERAHRLLQELGYQNIHVHIGDGSLGLPEFAPYQAIIVTAAAPKAPLALLEQLDEGGRLVIPVGGQWGQMLERWTRHGSQFEQEEFVPVAFVPLRGEAGWKENHWEQE